MITLTKNGRERERERERERGEVKTRVFWCVFLIFYYTVSQSYPKISQSGLRICLNASMSVRAIVEYACKREARRNSFAIFLPLVLPTDRWRAFRYWDASSLCESASENGNLMSGSISPRIRSFFQNIFRSSCAEIHFLIIFINRYRRLLWSEYESFLVLKVFQFPNVIISDPTGLAVVVHRQEMAIALFPCAWIKYLTNSQNMKFCRKILSKVFPV